MIWHFYAFRLRWINVCSWLKYHPSWYFIRVTIKWWPYVDLNRMPIGMSWLVNFLDSMVELAESIDQNRTKLSYKTGLLNMVKLRYHNDINEFAIKLIGAKILVLWDCHLIFLSIHFFVIHLYSENWIFPLYHTAWDT